MCLASPGALVTLKTTANRKITAHVILKTTENNHEMYQQKQCYRSHAYLAVFYIPEKLIITSARKKILELVKNCYHTTKRMKWTQLKKSSSEMYRQKNTQRNSRLFQRQKLNAGVILFSHQQVVLGSRIRHENSLKKLSRAFHAVLNPGLSLF